MLQIDETVSKQTLIRFLELPMVATTLTIYGVATLMSGNQESALQGKSNEITQHSMIIRGIQARIFPSFSQLPIDLLMTSKINV